MQESTAGGRRIFLLSIDLEDVRDGVPDGHRFAERVPAMTERYLEFFQRHQFRATFFIVGRTARRYPGLVRQLGRRVTRLDATVMTILR